MQGKTKKMKQKNRNQTAAKNRPPTTNQKNSSATNVPLFTKGQHSANKKPVTVGDRMGER